ncbi:hypothetical protein NQ314_019974 [Rhamnusium bicolor]|uniref:DUF4371 domain-containing protein n=1 Tax=Rhamnusium bicolor TaxID=1586634 RepID=A0AAV8WMW2_9CUCU|nr:hypothetical protein NQ314_019974 [Rhamnusium bicolor]
MEVEVFESEESNSASTMFGEASSRFSVAVNPSVSEFELQSSSSQVKTKQASRVQHFSKKWLADPKLQGWIQVAEHDNMYAKCSASVNAVKKLKSSKQVDLMLKHNLGKDQEHIDVVCTNLRSALLVAEHNFSFNVMDHITKINIVNFKDSKLKQQIKDNKVSVLLDEATDASNKKLLCILIKFIHGNEIKTQVLGLKEVDCDHGTAKGLYALLKQSLTEFNIEAKNVVGYCADNASVMMGSKESVKQYLLNSNPHLISNDCICHTIHLVAVSAAACLPERLENLLQNISTYFSRSPKRQSVLETFQEYMRNDKILEMWDVLTELFRLADFERESEVAKIIYNELCNPITKAYMLKNINSFIYSECLRFLKTLGSNFLKNEYLSDQIVNLNTLHPHCILPIDAIQVGSPTSDLIPSFDKNLKEQFLIKCLAFYHKAFQECLNRFPLNNFFKNLNFVQIDNALNPAVNTDIKCVAEKISPNNVDSCTKECNQLKFYFSEEEKSNFPKRYYRVLEKFMYFNKF